MTKSFRLNTLTRSLALISVVGLLAACNGSSNSDNSADTTDRMYQVAITNLTAGQPLSPVALVGHNSDYHAFTVGQASSVALEQLAEGGDNSALISEAGSHAGVYGTATASAPLAPGGTETLTLSVTAANSEDLKLTAVTMLVNTNDAITGLNGIDLSSLANGESLSMNTIGYDTGTEANSETAASIPGPAAGGEGFNADRDDISDMVLMHSGVVTADGGLADSTLHEMHRWDNPITRMTITRIQ